MLRWSPAEFRSATVWEVARAYDGYAQSKGIKKSNNSKLDGDDVRELQGWMGEHGDA